MKSEESSNTFLKTASISGFTDINIKELVLKYLKYWYWFLLSFIVCIGIAYMSLRYTTPMYNVSSTIVISQEDNLNDAGLAVFKDLGLDQAQDKIENEIQILKSKTLIRNVIKKLNLNIKYFYEGRVLDIEEYKNSIVTIDFLVPDSILAKKSETFNVLVNSETSFSFVNKDNEVISSHNFDSPVETKSGLAILSLNKKTADSFNKIIKIKLLPVRNLVDSYRARLAINVIGKNSSVLQVSLRDGIITRAENFVDNLINEYEIRTIKNKNETSDKTAQFINDRLNDISKDLAIVDSEAAKYMAKYGINEALTGASNNLADASSDVKSKIAVYETQNILIQATIDFINSENSKYNIIPNNLNINESDITTDIGRYNTLVLQRKRLLKTATEQNPIIVKIEDQLKGLRAVLFKSLNSQKQRIAIKLKSFTKREKEFNNKLYQAPEVQKDLRKIVREQGVTEQLYLYLLKKKETADITSHITIANSRVIDRATPVSLSPISPNKKSTYLVAILLGFLIPFIIIYATFLFSTSVKSKKDIEELISAPILGTIPKNKSKNKFVIDKTSKAPISEAFRILKTNIDFLLTKDEEETGLAKVIFTTSSISGEGKTFISSNIAKTLAVSGKKVAFIGTDFRFPRFHEILDLPNGKATTGFTNFIMDSKISIQDIIYKENNDSPIDIIPPGIIPPNPSGLLTNKRVLVMFEYLKEHYDYIVVDTAPISLVTDTLLISKLADLTVYVVKEGFSDKRLLTIPEKYHSEGRLINLAMVLNFASTNMSGAYGYGYGYNV